MSGSTRHARCIAALSILLSFGSATADASEPLFARCGLSGLDLSAGEKIAGRATQEGRSVIAPIGEDLLNATGPIVPGLLAFDVRLNFRSAPSALAAADRQERFCPSGARL